MDLSGGSTPSTFKFCCIVGGGGVAGSFSISTLNKWTEINRMKSEMYIH